MTKLARSIKSQSKSFEKMSKRTIIVLASAAVAATVSYFLIPFIKPYFASNWEFEQMEQARKLFILEDIRLIPLLDTILKKNENNFEARMLGHLFDLNAGFAVYEYAKTEGEKFAVRISTSTTDKEVLDMSAKYLSDHVLQSILLHEACLFQMQSETIDNLATRLLQCAPNRFYESFSWTYKCKSAKTNTARIAFCNAAIAACPYNMYCKTEQIQDQMNTLDIQEQELEIDSCLAQAPMNDMLVSMKMKCLIERKQYDQANQIAQATISFPFTTSEVLNIYVITNQLDVALKMLSDRIHNERDRFNLESWIPCLLLKMGKYSDVVAVLAMQEKSDTSEFLAYATSTLVKHQSLLHNPKGIQIEFANIMKPTKAEKEQWKEVLLIAIFLSASTWHGLLNLKIYWNHIQQLLEHDNLLVYLSTNAQIAMDLFASRMQTTEHLLDWNALCATAAQNLSQNIDPRMYYLQQRK